MRHTMHKLSNGYAIYDHVEQKYVETQLTFDEAIEWVAYPDDGPKDDDDYYPNEDRACIAADRAWDARHD